MHQRVISGHVHNQSLHVQHQFLSFVFLMVAFLRGNVRLYLIVLLICICLEIKDVDHLVKKKTKNKKLHDLCPPLLTLISFIIV